MPASRRDSKRNCLRKGESERPNGTYEYRYTERTGKRRSVYAKTLPELRNMEMELARDRMDGIVHISADTTLDRIYETWKEIKRGLKQNTFEQYTYFYEAFVSPTLGKRKVTDITKSDIKRLYNKLAEERGLKTSSIDNVHTVLHQVLEIAVDDRYIRNNPADKAMTELKRSHEHDGEKKRALTRAEEDLFLSYVKKNPKYCHWYPLFAIMAWTGIRVGELTGLRWCDINMEERTISVNHTLVYFNHRLKKAGSYFEINTPKTDAGKRTVPMLDGVAEAFEMQKENEREYLKPAVVDGYTDFIFVNAAGRPYTQELLNKALKRIIRDCNEEQFIKSDKPGTILPHFTCHTLRHTFTTRLCEAGVNVKVLQDVLGHTDVRTTLDIYADVTKEFKKEEFENLEATLKVRLKEKQKSTHGNEM